MSGEDKSAGLLSGHIIVIQSYTMQLKINDTAGFPTVILGICFLLNIVF